VTPDWLASVEHTVNAATHRKKTRNFEIYVFPVISRIAISEVKSPHVYEIIKPLIEAGKLETAHRIRSEISAAFAYAIAHGFTDYDPAQAVAKHKGKALGRVERSEGGRAIDAQHRRLSRHFTVQCALKISPLLFQRPGEIRQME
jgi:integrase